MNFRYTIGTFAVRQASITRLMLGMASRQDGSSIGAPMRTKSFCMSTTIKPALPTSSLNGTGYSAMSALLVVSGYFSPAAIMKFLPSILVISSSGISGPPVALASSLSVRNFGSRVSGNSKPG